MRLTERQSNILDTIIQEYIGSAQPVGSQLLEKKHSFGVSPATIRIEMQKLCDAGFIYQPHTSSGRVPTDNGYRFFVNKLIWEKGKESAGEISTAATAVIESWIDKEKKDTIRLVQNITKELASLSSALILSYLSEEKILWKEGWADVLQNPEFEEKEVVFDFAQFIKNFEDNIADLDIDSGLKIFIGRENPFSKTREFSTIISRCNFPDNEQGFLAILGPKRMSYDKNINSLNYLAKLLENI